MSAVAFGVALAAVGGCEERSQPNVAAPRRMIDHNRQLRATFIPSGC
jgi:hypothetical protein